MVFSRLLDWIFPRHCISCGKMNPQDGYEYLCKDCADGVFAHQVTRCKRCAEIVGSEFAPAMCAKCEGQKFNFSAARVVCEYADAGRDLVLELKYRKGLWVAQDIAKMCKKLADFDEYFKDAVIVPVPVHRRRKRTRGYNQSLMIACAIEKIHKDLNIKIGDILERVKSTSTQTALSRQERCENVKNAFKLKPNKISKDAKIIVLDDVMTSAATLNECANVLKKAGFKNIKVFAFARRS